MRRTKRMELAERLRGALPRYPVSDNKDDPVVVKTSEINLAVEYLRGLRDD